MLAIEAEPEAATTCDLCRGRGTVEIYFGGGLNDYAVESCNRCGGSGLNPTVAQRQAHDRMIRASIAAHPGHAVVNGVATPSCIFHHQKRSINP